MTAAVHSPRLRPTSTGLQLDPQPNVTTLASVIVVNYNSQAYLENCLQTLLDTTGDEIEIIVVDNGSSDDCLDQIADLFPEIRLDGRYHWTLP